MSLIVGLVGFAGVVVFGALYVISFLKGGSLKLPVIGMGVCFVLVVAVGALTHLGIGPFGDSAAEDDSAVTGAVESPDPDGTETVSAREPENGDISGEPTAEKISHTEYIGEDGKMIIVFKNNDSSQIPYFDAEITFFDENKNMVSVETDGHDAVLPGAEVVSIENTPENYDSYEITFKFEDYGRTYENLTKSLEVQDNIGENGVVARFTNNADKEIEELEVVAVYYKDGKVVGADEEEEYHIASGDHVTVQFYPPLDANYSKIDFDDYKIFINQAHNFNL